LETYKCVGCDGAIPWDGIGLLCYTCWCGATLFYETETLKLVMPASLISAIYYSQQLGVKPESPHIDYYLGDSSHTSEIKEAVAKQLLDMGLIWMKDCEQCQKDGTLEKKQKREKHLAVVEAEQILRE